MKPLSAENAEERLILKVQRDKKKWSYLAALIDGEGTISLFEVNNEKGTYYGAHLQVSNTSGALMKWLVENFGLNVSTRIHHTTFNKKPLHFWNVYGAKNKERILLGILPYLVIKKEQAKLALEFVRMFGEHNPEKRKELVTACKALNQA